jgi:hypothetical protein
MQITLVSRRHSRRIEPRPMNESSFRLTHSKEGHPRMVSGRIDRITA